MHLLEFVLSQHWKLLLYGSHHLIEDEILLEQLYIAVGRVYYHEIIFEIKVKN